MSQDPSIHDFIRQVERTDRRPESDKLRIAVLGIFGELGSLMSEIKKGIREGPAYTSYRNTLVEEAGDLLWYFAALAQTLGWPLSMLLTAALDSTVADFDSFSAIEQLLNGLPEPTLDPWLLAGERAGALAAHVGANGDDDALFGLAVSALRASLIAFRAEGVGLLQPICYNISKSLSRFPVSRKPLTLYDDRPAPDGKMIRRDERIPSYLPVDFREIQVGLRTVVVQSAFTIKIGDPLTDNIGEGDMYRFHDVFHLAYAAVLGWSPVLRALLKCKRKSNPWLDENQDGARAILVEEGISTFVFNHAKPHLFEGAKGVDYRLLSTIKEFVKGYEVEDQPLWAWERAILRGYDVFRELTGRPDRSGRVILDMSQRDIVFEPMDQT
jgi:NTP pyrophosphatase (non-canonical NTP hydrolase)